MQVLYQYLPQSKWPINVHLPLQGPQPSLSSSRPCLQGPWPQRGPRLLSKGSGPGWKSETPLQHALVFSFIQQMCIQTLGQTLWVECPAGHGTAQRETSPLETRGRSQGLYSCEALRVVPGTQQCLTSC